MTEGLTDQERRLLGLLGEVWHGYLALPLERPYEARKDDQREFAHHIHILQREIMCRPTRRIMRIDEIGGIDV